MKQKILKKRFLIEKAKREFEKSNKSEKRTFVTNTLGNYIKAALGPNPSAVPQVVGNKVANDSSVAQKALVERRMADFLAYRR